MHSGRPLSLASRSNREGLSRRVGIDAKAYKPKLAGASRQLSTGLPVPACQCRLASTGLPVLAC